MRVGDEITCLQCGTKVLCKHSKQKFCSKSCYRKHRYKNDKEWKQKIKKQNKRWYSKSGLEYSRSDKAVEYRKEKEEKNQKDGLTAWRSLQQRCNNPNNPRSKRYGQRGIKCLLTKEEFLAIYNEPVSCPICHVLLDNIPFSPNHRSIDRIDINRHYEQSNIRIVCTTCNARLNKIKNKNIRIGIKSGCFTLLHYGHLWCLQEAKRQVDWLIVLTNTDQYLEKNKKGSPIPLLDRQKLLFGLKPVDEVSSFPEDTEDRWVKNFKENRMSKEFGTEAELVIFHSDELKGRDWVPGQSFADQIIFIDKVGRQESVTQIYNRIKGT